MMQHHFAERWALLGVFGLVSAFGASVNPGAVTVTGPVKLTTPLRDPGHGYSYN